MILEICIFVIGFICSMVYNSIRNYLSIRIKYILPYSKLLKYTEDDKLVFIKRVNDTVYFSGYKELEIIYNITSNSISAFNGDRCVLVPIKSVSKINSDIINEIELKYYKQIYVEISVHNGIVYSNNLIPNTNDYIKKSQNTVRNNNINQNIQFILEDDLNLRDINDELQLDDILNKIKKYGIDSLTKMEQSFIKNIDNWN